MKKVLWIILHSLTALIILSGIASYYGRPTLALTSSAPTTTFVQGSITFPKTLGTANPNEVFALVNAYRAERGLSALIGDPTLTELAEQRADDMVARQYYAHKNPDGKNFYEIAQEGGYAPGYACENLSLEPSNDPRASFVSWETSTHGHNECMLNTDVTRAGYASRKLYDVPTVKGMTPYYLVVAIHGSAN